MAGLTVMWVIWSVHYVIDTRERKHLEVETPSMVAEGAVDSEVCISAEAASWRRATERDAGNPGSEDRDLVMRSPVGERPRFKFLEYLSSSYARMYVHTVIDLLSKSS